MIRRVATLLYPYRWRIGLGFVLLVVVTPMQLFHPLVWMYVADDVIGLGKHAMLLPAILCMMLVHYAGMALDTWRTYILGIAGQRLVADIREQLHEKFMGQSVSYFHEQRSGDLVSRMNSDVEALQSFIVEGFDNILGNFLSLLCVAGVILWLTPVVGSVALLPLVGVALIVCFFNARVKRLYRRIRDRLGDLSAVLQEHLLGIAVIKSFARERQANERFNEGNESYLRDSFKGVLVRSIYFPAVMSFGFLSNVAMIGLGGYLVIQGQMTIGVLLALRGYWWPLFNPVFSLAQTNELFQRAMASSGRIFDVLDSEVVVVDAPGAVELVHARGAIAFDDVAFAYREDRPVLRGVSFSAAEGDRIGIVGPSGVGKSTLLNLVLRLYDVHTGCIRLDNHDIRSLTQLSLRQHMALVGQESFLFNDSIRNNILFGRLDAPDEAVEEAARMANAHEFIMALPDGYDTAVGERGVKLSGGQKQRICIARAFLANPKVLLLDEATASVEPESEALIQAALERLEKGRTTILVSHRLSVVRDCDAILVIGEGTISERGTHEELLAAGGWYARMHQLQTAGVCV